MALKTKDTETHSEGVACGISAVVAGVTEPAMFGINLRFVRPMIAAIISAGIAGLFCGITAVRGYVMTGTISAFTVISFIGGESPLHDLIFGSIGGILSVLLSTILSYVLHKDPEATTGNRSDNFTVNPPAGGVVIESPIPGKVIPLNMVPDDPFAAGILGEGFAVEPVEGKVYASFDGMCGGTVDSMHALNLVSDSGVELLIHVGLEIVGLNGKPFKVHIKEGQMLMEFDMKMIEAMGCKTVSPVVVTNSDDLSGLRVESGKILIGERGL